MNKQAGIPKIPERCCLNCVFLFALADGQKDGVRIDFEDRLEIIPTGEVQLQDLHDTAVKWGLRCSRGVWEQDVGVYSLVGPEESPWGSEIANDRGEDCFFFNYRRCMDVSAATEMEHREADRREAEKDRKLTRRALYVAFGALVVSIAASVASIIVQCALAK